MKILSKIGLRLSVGFLIILLILISLTLFAIDRMDILAHQTEEMYNHPLTVSNAVLRINTNIIKMHRAMKDITLSDNEDHIRLDEQSVNELEQEVLNDFEIIRERFLGKKEVIENALTIFMDWKPIRDEVITLMRQGEVSQAVNITKSKGARYVELIEESIGALGDFAQIKAREFLIIATSTKALSFRTMYFVMAIAIILSFIFAAISTLSITIPLASIKKTIEAIKTGKRDSKILIKSKDELGELANTFNSMMNNLSEITASRDELNIEIDERRKAEEALRLSEEFLKKSQEIAHVGSWHLDIKRNVLEWSDEQYRIFGHTPQSFGATYDTFLEAVHPDDREMVNEKYTEAINNKTPYECVHRILRPNGETRTVIEKSDDIVDENGKTTHSYGMTLDITKQKLHEDELYETIKEKELLLKEVYHRVKNNLAVIQSLLSLQVREIDDERSKGYLTEAEGRVKSMTLIHEMLQDADDITELGASKYISKLAATLFQNYKVQENQIKLNIDIQDIKLDVDTIIPLGLIINELVTNALKYAFADNENGDLSISLKKTTDNHYELVIEDSGVGMPEGFDIMDAKTLGLRIVRILTSQINGTVEVSNNTGVKYRISFADKTID
jgi:PAS domain S-box-containing protein